jgi:NADH-quinone oxidoreductase subunit E
MTEPATKLPQELAGLVNLTVHPVAAVAAVSALGLGLASQGLGLWLGTMTAAAETLGRLASSAAEPEAKSTASQRAEATTRTLIAKARRVAREVAEASAETPQPKPAQAALEPTPVLPSKPAGAPIATAKPKKPDDLKKIAGIGPKLEIVLNGLGIWSFAQIAMWSPAEIAWLDDHLGFSGRIGRDRWVEQAAALSRGKRQA